MICEARGLGCQEWTIEDNRIVRGWQVWVVTGMRNVRSFFEERRSTIVVSTDLLFTLGQKYLCTDVA